MLSVDGKLQEIAERSNPESIVVASDCSPLDFMLAIMRDGSQPMQRRTRMAIAAAPFCHPKLEAHALLNSPASLAERLTMISARRKAGQVKQAEAIAAARERGDIDGALAIARQDPLLFDHYDPDPKRLGAYTRRIEKGTIVADSVPLRRL